MLRIAITAKKQQISFSHHVKFRPMCLNHVNHVQNYIIWADTCRRIALVALTDSLAGVLKSSQYAKLISFDRWGLTPPRAWAQPPPQGSVTPLTAYRYCTQLLASAKKPHNSLICATRRPANAAAGAGKTTWLCNDVLIKGKLQLAKPPHPPPPSTNCAHDAAISVALRLNAQTTIIRGNEDDFPHINVHTEPVWSRDQHKPTLNDPNWP